MGQDGWLFLSGDSNDVLGQHTGRVRPGPRWRRAWLRLFADRMQAMERLGADWTLLLAPDKEAVYADKLPPGVEPAERRTVHDFIDLAEESNAPLIYPLSELQSARAQGFVYYQTDTHWTALGAHVAYRRVCERLAERGVYVPVVGSGEIEWTQTRGPGDLGIKLEPSVAGEGVEARVRDSRSRLVADNRVRGTGRVCVYESDLRDAPRAVILGSSFAPSTLQFFRESFSRLVFQHTASHDNRLLRAERPDVVITVRGERGLLLVASDRGAHRRLAKMAARKPASEKPLSWD
jgi:hypothetical protein